MRPFAIPLLLLGILAASCNRGIQSTSDAAQPSGANSPIPVGDNSQTSLDWPGLYSSIVPMSDGTELETSLRIRDDLTYVLRTRPSASQEPPSEHTGRFVWVDDGEAIKLMDIDSTDRPIYYAVGENYLRQMDLINRPIEGSLSELYYLRKDPTNLLDRRWQLDSLPSGTVETAKPAPFISLSANGQHVTGYAGCNSLNGTYFLSGDSLTFSPLTTTKMACPKLTLEKNFLSALDATVRYAVDGKSLRLIDSRGNPVAVLRETNRPD